MALDGDWFSALLELGGEGDGPAALARRASVVALVVAAFLLILGGYFALVSESVVTIDASALEDGVRPAVYDWNGRRNTMFQEVTGRLVQPDAVVFSKSGSPWMCAPLVSARPGSDDAPHVYYEAPEGAYLRARAESRFIGRLYRGVSPRLRAEFEAQGRAVGADAWVLTYSPVQRTYGASASGFLILGLFLGAPAAAALFILSRRKQPL